MFRIDKADTMIIEIALGILLAYILIATIEYWLPFLVWIVIIAVTGAILLVAYLAVNG